MSDLKNSILNNDLKPISVASRPVPWILLGAALAGLLGNLSVVHAQAGGPTLLAPEFEPDASVSRGRVLYGPLPTPAISDEVMAPRPRTGPAVAPVKIPLDYWIVSSRKCPQQGAMCESCDCIEYFYQGPAGKLERRALTDFKAAFDPQVPICVMVHGSLVDWEALQAESAATYRWLKSAAPDQRLQVVFYTWPSERHLSALAALDFSILGERASFNSLYLGKVIAQFPPGSRVSLIGHSHGARLVASTLHLTSGGEMHGYTLLPPQHGWPRLRAVFAAAAIDQHWLLPGQRYGQALIRPENVLNLRNSGDAALSLYPFRQPFGIDALGRSGFPGQLRMPFSPLAPKIKELEVSPLLGLRHNWPDYYEHPELAQSLKPYVYYSDDVAQSPAPRAVRTGSFPGRRSP